MILRALVKGLRLAGADGVYFDKLKLTPKGQQMAIHQRKTVEETKKALSEVVKEANSVMAEIAKSTGKE